MTVITRELTEKRNELDAKRAKLAEVFKEAGSDLDMSLVKAIDGDSAAKVEWIRKSHEEINDLGAEVEKLAAVAAAAKAAQVPAGEAGQGPGIVHPTIGQQPKGAPAQTKTLGELFIESPAVKVSGGQGPMATLDVEVKTLFATSAGWAPETTRTGMMVPFATRPIQVTDTIPSTTTGQAAVKYMEETTFTNAAVETDEAGTYQESALALTERTSPVEKIATWLPVTDEQLEDVSQVSGYIDNRLSFMLRQRLDAQILVGDGTAPNLSGILDRVGLQTQAKGADPTPDAVYKAMMLVRVTGRAIPNVVYAHPTDWQDVRLLRTTDGIYIWGSPADPGPDRIWGLPVVLTDAITLNTMLVGDTTFAELAYRRGIDIQVSNSHSDFFINGKQAIRADVRVALQVYRPSAFAQVTGV
jgi:HK97 family phage major capsid protein